MVQAPVNPTPIAQSKPKAPAAQPRNRAAAVPATVAAEQTDQEAPKRAVTLDSNRLREAEHERLVYRCYPPKEHTIEDLKRPAYWASVTPKLRPWEKIEVCAEDGLWYAELLVTAVERSVAVVHVLKYDELSSVDVGLSTLAGASKYEIKHTPGLKWHVIRKLDRHIVKDGLARREDAEFALQEHLKTIPT